MPPLDLDPFAGNHFARMLRSKTPPPILLGDLEPKEDMYDVGNPYYRNESIPTKRLPQPKDGDAKEAIDRWSNSDSSIKTVHEAYKLLGVPKDAPLDAISRRFQKLAMSYHPDKAKDGCGDSKKMSEYSVAYQLIKQNLNLETTSKLYMEEWMDDNHNWVWNQNGLGSTQEEQANREREKREERIYREKNKQMLEWAVRRKEAEGIEHKQAIQHAMKKAISCPYPKVVPQFGLPILMRANYQATLTNNSFLFEVAVKEYTALYSKFMNYTILDQICRYEQYNFQLFAAKDDISPGNYLEGLKGNRKGLVYTIHILPRSYKWREETDKERFAKTYKENNERMKTAGALKKNNVVTAVKHTPYKGLARKGLRKVHFLGARVASSKKENEHQEPRSYDSDDAAYDDFVTSYVKPNFKKVWEFKPLGFPDQDPWFKQYHENQIARREGRLKNEPEDEDPLDEDQFFFQSTVEGAAKKHKTKPEKYWGASGII